MSSRPIRGSGAEPRDWRDEARLMPRSTQSTGGPGRALHGPDRHSAGVPCPASTRRTIERTVGKSSTSRVSKGISTPAALLDLEHQRHQRERVEQSSLDHVNVRPGDRRCRARHGRSRARPRPDRPSLVPIVRLPGWAQPAARAQGLRRRTRSLTTSTRSTRTQASAAATSTAAPTAAATVPGRASAASGSASAAAIATSRRPASHRGKPQGERNGPQSQARTQSATRRAVRSQSSRPPSGGPAPNQRRRVRS